MDTLRPDNPLSMPEQERLAALLAALLAVQSPAQGWAVRHMHAPLLCELGLLEPPDPAYAQAAHRRFADPATARRRALALMDELERDLRRQRDDRRRRDRRA